MPAAIAHVRVPSTSSRSSSISRSHNTSPSTVAPPTPTSVLHTTQPVSHDNDTNKLTISKPTPESFIAMDTQETDSPERDATSFEPSPEMSDQASATHRQSGSVAPTGPDYPTNSQDVKLEEDHTTREGTEEDDPNAHAIPSNMAEPSKEVPRMGQQMAHPSPPPRIEDHVVIDVPLPAPPKSSYYYGPPPSTTAFGTEPIGTIGLHHPREIVRIERDYEHGELCQFSSAFPLELEGRITPTEFLETINAINEILISAHSVKAAMFDNLLAIFSLYLSTFVRTSHYTKEMRRLKMLVDNINEQLYNLRGLHILWPRKVAFLFLEIEYY